MARQKFFLKENLALFDFIVTLNLHTFTNVFQNLSIPKLLLEIEILCSSNGSI